MAAVPPAVDKGGFWKRMQQLLAAVSGARARFLADRLQDAIQDSEDDELYHILREATVSLCLTPPDSIAESEHFFTMLKMTSESLNHMDDYGEDFGEPDDALDAPMVGLAMKLEESHAAACGTVAPCGTSWMSHLTQIKEEQSVVVCAVHTVNKFDALSDDFDDIDVDEEIAGACGKLRGLLKEAAQSDDMAAAKMAAADGRAAAAKMAAADADGLVDIMNGKGTVQPCKSAADRCSSPRIHCTAPTRGWREHAQTRCALPVCARCEPTP